MQVRAYTPPLALAWGSCVGVRGYALTVRNAHDRRKAAEARSLSRFFVQNIVEIEFLDDLVNVLLRF